MRAELKGIHSPDLVDNATPDDVEDFCILMQIFIGPQGQEGEESFDVLVCTPNGLERKLESSQVISLRHYLLVSHYDLGLITNFIKKWFQVLKARIGMNSHKNYLE